MNWQQKRPKQLFILLLVALLGWGIASCSKPSNSGLAGLPSLTRSKLTEVSPPFVIQNLKPALDIYQPQVKIVSPRSEQIVNQTEVEVKLQVSDLDLYKDEELELGPYLQILLDNQPYTQVYDLSEPLVIENLSPGTHTLRVFAVKPWHESFKTDGAFAQTSFHVFAETGEHQPDPTQPLLTYNAPQGVIGAEPVLLDFYLTNTPLHLVAREDAEDAIPDWQVRCTINGDSFTFDRWEPIYLKGLKPGRNWVQLELLDENGNALPNVFNNSVQLITYEPGGIDTLSRLIRGELTAEAARKIVDPNYVPPAPEPEVILEPDVVEPDVTEELTPEEIPPEVIAPPVEDTVEKIFPDTEETLDKLPDVPAEPELEEPDVVPQAEPDLQLPTEPESDAIEELLKPELLKPEPLKPPAPVITPTTLPAPVKPSPLPIIIAPEGNAPPVKVKTMTSPVAPSDLQPNSFQPVSPPETLPLIEPVEPLLPEEPDPMDVMKSRLEEVFQPDTTAFPETTPLPAQLEIPAPVQPIEIQPEPVLAPQSLLEPVPEAPTPAAAVMPLLVAPSVSDSPELSVQPPEIPNMVGALDRVKGFFENLRKRPDEPTLPLLLEDERPDESL